MIDLFLVFYTCQVVAFLYKGFHSNLIQWGRVCVCVSACVRRASAWDFLMKACTATTMVFSCHHGGPYWLFWQLKFYKKNFFPGYVQKI